MSLIGSLRLTANDHLQYHELQSATYLLKENACLRVPLVLRGGFDRPPSVFVTHGILVARRMRRDVRSVLRRSEAWRSLGLVGRVSSPKVIPRLVEFLVSFTALEQYVRGLDVGGKPACPDSATWRLAGPGTEAARDVAEFRALYRVRNNLAHEGQLVVDRSLAERVRALLARYLTWSH